MGLSKSCKIKLFQQTTGWSTDKMRANKKVVNAICDGTDNAITYDEQNLTEEQQAQARQNIGAANDSEVVKHISQNLTEEQKAQARTNIGTISREEAEALVANNAIVVAALPEPSAETMGKTYLLGPDQNDNYIRYITSYDGVTYTWVPYGSTEMNLTQYAQKDTNAIEDNLAKFDANGNPVDSGISKDDVALKNGSYDNMSVGTAKNLEGRSVVTDSFFQRTTGGDAEISNGTAQLVEVKGKSQVWNQLVSPYNILSIFRFPFDIDNTNGNSALYARVRNGNENNGLYVGPLTNGHKYFISNTIEFTSEYTYNKYYCTVQQTQGINYHLGKGIQTATDNANDGMLFIQGLAAGKRVSGYITLQKFDLTLLGIDNLTTVEEVEAWFAENIGTLPYYPYNAGQVINNNFQGIESIGQNLLDPATGKAIILGEYSDVYGNYYGITGTHGTITFTDNLGNSETITPDAEGKFEILVPGTLTVATPGEDCSVFLWWDGTKTEYTPYEVNVGKLDVTHIYGKKNGTGELVQVWPTGMPGINDIKDSLKVVDGQVVAERKIGEVDMGAMNWIAATQWSQIWMYVIQSDCINPTTYSDAILCSKYQTLAGGGDKSCRIGNGKRLWVRDSDYEDANIFKSAMAGQKMYYELATPEVYTDLVYQGSSLFTDGTPVTLPVNYRVDNWGIENILPKNTESQILTSKPTIICRYSIDAIEMLDTHDAEINQLGEQIEELDERKPEKVGDYPGMSVGSAKTLAGNDTNVEDFVFKALDCADGIAKLNSVRGKSLVWNQIVQNGNFANGTIQWDANPTYGTLSAQNGVCTYSVITPYSSVLVSQTLNGVIAGHKYLLSLSVKYNSHIPTSTGAYAPAFGFGGAFIYEENFVLGVYKTIKGIFTTVNDSGKNLNFYLRTNSNGEEGDTIDIKDVFVIDLTLMFGAGNEPTTVAEFEAMFPLPYYDYNEGEIISNKTDEIKVVGFNQWDGTITETDKYINKYGVPTYSADYNVSDFIHILPNKSYYLHKLVLNVASSPAIVWYDSDKQFISGLSGGDKLYNKVVTSPIGAAYLKVSLYKPTIDEICINFSDSSRNDEYEPYKTNTIELNLPTLTGKLNGEGDSVIVFPDGLKSVESAYDEIIGNKAIKRVGKIVYDGSESWYSHTLNDETVFYNPIQDIIVNATPSITQPSPIICSKYKYLKPYGAVHRDNSDKACWYRGGGFSVVYNDSQYANLDEFKASMVGAVLYYELATPEEYILDTPIPDTFQAYKGGTIKQLPENTNEPVTAPCIITATFSIDAVGTIIGLPKNYISKESLQAMLNAMQSAGIISSYTMTFNENTNKYDFTFVAPSNS